MSGYLQRLVERTLGVGNVVQPLLAPRFASGPSLTGGVSEAWEQTEAAPQVPGVAPERAAREEGDRPRQPTQPGEQVGSPYPSEVLSTSPEMHTLPKLEGAPAAPPKSQPEPTLPGFLPHETLPDSAVSGSPLDIAAEFKAEAIEDLRESPRETLPVDRGTEARPAPTRDSGEHLETQPLIEEEAPLAPRLVSRAAPGQPSTEAGVEIVAVEPRTMDAPPEPVRTHRAPDETIPRERHLIEHFPASEPTSMPSMSENLAQTTTQPRPVIRVTIGRIEVRAAAPTAAATRQAPPRPAPALTLQEYLKQRNGGER